MGISLLDNYLPINMASNATVISSYYWIVVVCMLIPNGITPNLITLRTLGLFPILGILQYHLLFNHMTILSLDLIHPP